MTIVKTLLKWQNYMTTNILHQRQRAQYNINSDALIIDGLSFLNFPWSSVFFFISLFFIPVTSLFYFHYTSLTNNDDIVLKDYFINIKTTNNKT